MGFQSLGWWYRMWKKSPAMYYFCHLQTFWRRVACCIIIPPPPTNASTIDKETSVASTPGKSRIEKIKRKPVPIMSWDRQLFRHWKYMGDSITGHGSVCITTTWSAWRQEYLFDWILNVSNATKYWNCVFWMDALNLDMNSQTWLLSLTFWYWHRVRLLPWNDPKPWFCLHSRPIICWKYRLGKIHVADAIFIPLEFLTYLLTIEEKLFDWVLCILFYVTK